MRKKKEVEEEITRRMKNIIESITFNFLNVRRINGTLGPYFYIRTAKDFVLKVLHPSAVVNLKLRLHVYLC